MLLGQHAKIQKGKCMDIEGGWGNSPLSGYFDVSGTALTGTVIFFVDGDILLAAARTVLLVDLDFLLYVATTLFLAGKSSGEGRVTLFVTFPSDARSSWR